MFRSLSFIWLIAASVGAFAQERMPVDRSEVKASNDYWLPAQVNHPRTVASFQSLVSAPSDKVSSQTLQGQPIIEIALVYPSTDVSDFWVRNYQALTQRLSELGIAFSVTEFTSRQVQHSLQTRQVDELLQRDRPYDFVIFGPTELAIQAKNIQRLSARDDFFTFIWAFHTPKKSWSYQPDMWLDFSSHEGAISLCHYLIDRLGQHVNYALNRGILGITDDQRSGDFAHCVNEEGGWVNAYEHFGQYQKKGGIDGYRLIAKNFPEVEVLHNANTAMAIGVVEERAREKAPPALLVTGWGGTAIELEKIRSGELNATPMRFSDDVGVASAEAIKLFLLGQQNQVPNVYLGRITIANDQMATETLDDLEAQAFRYSEPTN